MNTIKTRKELRQSNKDGFYKNVDYFYDKHDIYDEKFSVWFVNRFGFCESESYKDTWAERYKLGSETFLSVMDYESVIIFYEVFVKEQLRKAREYEAEQNQKVAFDDCTNYSPSDWQEIQRGNY